MYLTKETSLEKTGSGVAFPFTLCRRTYKYKDKHCFAPAHAMLRQPQDTILQKTEFALP